MMTTKSTAVFFLIFLFISKVNVFSQWHSEVGRSISKRYRNVMAFTGTPYNYECGEGTGLNSAYYHDTRLRDDARIYGKEPNVDLYVFRESPVRGIKGNRFSIRWDGYLYAPVTGRYQFTAIADDGMRIWINDEMVMDEWREQSESDFTFELELNEGELYKIKIDYLQLRYDHAVAQLYWRYSGQFKTIIPVNYLFPKVPVPCQQQPVAQVPASVKIENKAPILVEENNEVEIASIEMEEEDMREELEKTKKIVLDKVLFDQGKYTFKQGDTTTFEVLEELLEIMKENTNMKILIEGHTDNIGDYQANLRLSRNRAMKVAMYLIENGIQEMRLQTKGFGPSQPIALNDTEAGRAKNRRVEAKILSQ